MSLVRGVRPNSLASHLEHLPPPPSVTARVSGSRRAVTTVRAGAAAACLAYCPPARYTRPSTPCSPRPGACEGSRDAVAWHLGLLGGAGLGVGAAGCELR